jgi:hypothetical protein
VDTGHFAPLVFGSDRVAVADPCNVGDAAVKAANARLIASSPTLLALLTRLAAARRNGAIGTLDPVWCDVDAALASLRGVAVAR